MALAGTSPGLAGARRGPSDGWVQGASEWQLKLPPGWRSEGRHAWLKRLGDECDPLVSTRSALHCGLLC